jgi:hypothetical protein
VLQVLRPRVVTNKLSFSIDGTYLTTKGSIRLNIYSFAPTLLRTQEARELSVSN